MSEMRRATSNSQISFLSLPRSAQSHLCDAQEYGPPPLYECQNAPLSTSWTLQSIQCASQEIPIQKESATPAALLRDFLRTSIRQNLFCFFSRQSQSSFLPQALQSSILRAFHN